MYFNDDDQLGFDPRRANDWMYLSHIVTVINDCTPE